MLKWDGIGFGCVLACIGITLSFISQSLMATFLFTLDGVLLFYYVSKSYKLREMKDPHWCLHMWIMLFMYYLYCII